MTEPRNQEPPEGFIGHTDVENEGENADRPEPQFTDEREFPEPVQEDAGQQQEFAAGSEQQDVDQRFEETDSQVVHGEPEENVDQQDAAFRAQSQIDAQDQANQGYELEFENRIAPLRDEVQTYRDDLANSGDEAGAAHASHFLDMIIQRFRLPGDVASPEADQENQEQ